MEGEVECLLQPGAGCRVVACGQGPVGSREQLADPFPQVGRDFADSQLEGAALNGDQQPLV